MTKSESAAKIAALNDAARRDLAGNVRLVVTHGIQCLPQADQLAIVQKVRTFDRFDEDNDPYGERDFGAFDQNETRIFWKVDYYNLTPDGGSLDPSDEQLTCRVLTILLASEY